MLVFWPRGKQIESLASRNYQWVGSRTDRPVLKAFPFLTASRGCGAIYTSRMPFPPTYSLLLLRTWLGNGNFVGQDG